MNNQNDQLRAIAVKILNKSQLPRDDEYAFAVIDENCGFTVITVLMVISIILTCVRILQECNKTKLNSLSSNTDKYSLYGEQIKLFSNNRGWFTKMRIKKILRKQMDTDAYHKYGLSLLSAILDIGATLTDEEIITLVEAANV